MTWWGWMIFGAVLLGAELIAIDAQFYLVFLGLSAALVGLASLMGIDMALWAQWVTFALLSLVSMVTFRQALYARIRGNVPGFHASIAGETLEVTEELGPGQESRAEFRGSTWTVRNVGSEPIAAGARASVIKADGLTLHVSTDQS